MFRYGEKWNKFFFLIKGCVSILIPREEKIFIKLKDYYKYLNSLLQNQEKLLLFQCLVKNSELLTFREYSDYDYIRATRNQTLTKEQELMIAIALTEKYLSKRHNGELSKTQQFKIKIAKFLELSKHKTIQEIEYENANSNPITVEEYLKNISYSTYVIKDKNQIPIDDDIYDELDLNQAINAVVYQYELSRKLYSGAKFGDSALDNHSEERSATVISTEETHLSSIQKNNYVRLLKEVEFKHKRAFLSRLLVFEVFSRTTYPILKVYNEHFAMKNCILGNKIFEENKESENVYFIEKGEFRVTMRKSIKELDKILKFYNEKVEIQRYELDFKTGLKRHLYEKFIKEKHIINVK